MGTKEKAMRYWTRVLTVDAIQYTGANLGEVDKFVGERCMASNDGCWVPGNIRHWLPIGSWLVRYLSGFVVVSPRAMELYYQPAVEGHVKTVTACENCPFFNAGEDALFLTCSMGAEFPMARIETGVFQFVPNPDYINPSGIHPDCPLKKGEVIVKL